MTDYPLLNYFLFAVILAWTAFSAVVEWLWHTGSPYFGFFGLLIALVE